jgi:transposase-like protein
MYGDVDLDAEPESLPGPWVFGLCTNRSYVRFVIVENRSADTLIPIIQNQVSVGSLIWSDQWAAYNNLPAYGFSHQTVNHSENFIDPITGANTQKIERYWKEGKIRFKTIRRPSNMMQSHLDEIAWRINHKTDNILEVFLRDVRKYYTVPLE